MTPTSCSSVGSEDCGGTGGHLRGAKETEKAGFIRSKSRDAEWRMHSPRRSKREERGEREAPGGGGRRGGGDSWLNYLVPLVFLLPAPGSGETRVYLLTWGQAVSDSLETPLPDFQKQFLYQTFLISILWYLIHARS